VAAFIEILTSGASVMRTVVQHLLASADASVTLPALFIHCTTGNNRTGVFVALLLLLLHVPTRYIVQEYTLSEIGLAATRHVNVERLLKKGAFKEYGEVGAKKKCERMVAARKESMEALLNEVKRRWDGADRYFLEVVGLTRDELRRVRGLLTVEGRGEWVEETL
jgi:protein tyrosine/serine phosphatase